MMKTNTKIENGRVFLDIKYEIDWSDIINIISYMEEMEATVCFENGDAYNHYDNLLDYTGMFRYSDCESLFGLGLVNSS